MAGAKFMKIAYIARNNQKQSRAFDRASVSVQAERVRPSNATASGEFVGGVALSDSRVHAVGGGQVSPAQGSQQPKAPPLFHSRGRVFIVGRGGFGRGGGRSRAGKIGKFRSGTQTPNAIFNAFNQFATNM